MSLPFGMRAGSTHASNFAPAKTTNVTGIPISLRAMRNTISPRAIRRDSMRMCLAFLPNHTPAMKTSVGLMQTCAAPMHIGTRVI